MTNKSESIVNLAVAIAAAQAEMPVIAMNMQNKFLKSSYADLGAVIAGSRPILAKHGLSVTQFPVSTDNGRVGLTTIVLHTSGEFIEDTIYLAPEQNKGLSNAQSAGVVISYLRRYAWSAVLGLYSDEDIDGEMRQAEDAVGKVVADPKTGEVPMQRVFSFDQMDAAIALSEGAITTYEEMQDILSASVLPESATPKAVASWFKHYLSPEDKNSTQRAIYANGKYLAAKKNGGK